MAKRKTEDVNEAAFRVVRESSSEPSETAERGKERTREEIQANHEIKIMPFWNGSDMPLGSDPRIFTATALISSEAL